MFFSIIVPIYNAEKYLKECVDSILSQTFKDFELILVDDGSIDKSAKICDEYANSYRNVEVIHKQNGGQSSARNFGIRKAQGEYIVFIDSDDYIISYDFLDKLNKNLNGQDFILYKHQKLFDASKKLEPCIYSYAVVDENDSYAKAIEKLISEDSFYGMAWIKAVKRKLILEKNIFFDESLVCEDMDWNYNLSINSNSLAVVDESFIAYRQRENSVTSSLKLKNLTDFIYVIEKWSKKIQSEEMDENFKVSLFGSMAKYYSNLLITYSRIKDNDKKQYIKRIKALSWLLRYAKSSRPKMVAKIYRFFGFGLTIKALKIVDKR